jgi:hypothetical protein
LTGYGREGLVAIITLKLIKNGKCIVYLTEKTIDKFDLLLSKVRGFNPQQLTTDIDMTIRIDSANLHELYVDRTDPENGESLPREIDSARELLGFAFSPPGSEYCYMDGEVVIVDGFAKSASLHRFKDLFVMHIEEEYSIKDRDTHIHILLRERGQ